MMNRFFIKSFFIFSILRASSSFAAEAGEGCTLEHLFYPATCVGATTYVRDYPSAERSSGPYKVTKSLVRTEEGVIGELQLLRSSTLSKFSHNTTVARTKGCLEGICVGQLVRVPNQTQTYKVLGYYTQDNAMVLGICETGACNQGSNHIAVNVSRERVRPTDKVSFGEDQAKSVDNSVLAEIEREFQQFDGITMAQYLNLKKNRNSDLLNAQRMVKQYLDSTALQLTSDPSIATQNEINAEFNRRQQFYKSPLMIQTGLEIVAHELLKPQEKIQCPVVATALRFVALGVDGWGNKTPGLDYINNQLMIVHLYAAMVERNHGNALPCEQEFSDLTIKNPSLKNQYRPGCGPNSWDVRCQTEKGKFWDTETLMAITKLARTYVKNDYSFSGGGGSSRSGFFGMSKGYYASYETSIYFDAPEKAQRRWATLVFEYERPRPRGALFDSTVSIIPSEGDTRVRKEEVPRVNSQQVMFEYGKLAEAFLD